MINEVTLVGYVGKDAQVQTFDNGKKVAVFTLATSKTYKDAAGQEQTVTQWHNVAAWNYLADIKVSKGMMVMVKGEVVYRTYTDKDNIERKITDIVASRLYEIQKQVRDKVPMPGLDDIPPLAGGGAARMNKEVAPADELFNDDFGI